MAPKSRKAGSQRDYFAFSELAYNTVLLCHTSDIKYGRLLHWNSLAELTFGGCFAESMDRTLRIKKPKNSVEGWRSV